MDGSNGLTAATMNSYRAPVEDNYAGKNARDLSENDFYQLMVAQLTHQDPLKPVGNTEYVAQLAQFTSLAQLNSINDNLLYLQMYQAALNNTLAVSLVGKDVKVGTADLELENGDCNKVWYTLGSDAPQVDIRITDKDGTLVAKEELGPLDGGDFTFEWDGTDINGNPAPDGDYTFEIVAQTTEGTDIPVTYGIRARVTGISFEDGTTYLLLGDQRVPLSEVSEIHEGESTDGE